MENPPGSASWKAPSMEQYPNKSLANHDLDKTSAATGKIQAQQPRAV
jgi:hypothetical protein